MRSFFVLLLLGIILITIGLVVRSGMLARNNPGRPINSAMRSAMEKAGGTYEWPARDQPMLAQRYAGALETPSGMRYLIKQPGTGTATPQRGQTATVTYVGTFLDGSHFDSSAQHGGPFNFNVGEGRVIAGWDEAILTMRKGEKRTLVIPYWLAYGERGISRKIPAKATLVFDIELLDFK